MDDVADDTVVAEGQKLFPGGVPGVPAAEGGRRLIREHDKVFGMVKNSLSTVLLGRKKERRILSQSLHKIDF